MQKIKIAKRDSSVSDVEQTVIQDHPQLKRQPDALKAVVLFRASLLRGTHTDDLAKWSGYSRSFVRSVARKFRQAAVWENVGSNKYKALFRKEYDAVNLSLVEYGQELGANPDLADLRRLHEEINDYRRDLPGNYGIWNVRRPLTADEWKRIGEAIQAHGLIAVMRTSSYGFNLALDILEPGHYPGISPSGVIAIHQKALPEKMLPSNGLQGSKDFNPTIQWNATWKIFSDLAFNERNLEMVKACGINMPTNKSRYIY